MKINGKIDNKLFWKSAYPLFSEKHIPKNSKMTLLEKNEILTLDAKIAGTFSKFFKNVVNTLYIEKRMNVFYATLVMTLIQ